MSKERPILTLGGAVVGSAVVIPLIPKAFKMMQQGSVTAKRFWDAFHKNFKPPSSLEAQYSTEDWIEFFEVLLA